MSASELLVAEVHRLMDLYIITSTAYYKAPIENHEAELGAQSAAICAAHALARAIAKSHAWGSTYETALREAIDEDRDYRVRKHLEQVLTKLLALAPHATTDTCGSSPTQ